MTLLPQRKKSAEEIAQLRDKLGIPENSAPAANPSNENATSGPSVEEPEPAQTEIRPEPQQAKPVRSLKKAERLPTDAQQAQDLRSDRLPELQRNAIPARRHSNEELEGLRKREALSMLDGPTPNPKLAKANGLLIGLGYVCAISAAGCFIIKKFPLTATASCIAIALLIALFISIRRPISRHHAGFIAAISFVVSVFSALHFFPQLHHAS